MIELNLPASSASYESNGHAWHRFGIGRTRVAYEEMPRSRQRYLCYQHRASRS
jgi:hypothetical protein